MIASCHTKREREDGATFAAKCLNQVPIREMNSALSTNMLALSAAQDHHKGCHWVCFKDRLRVDMSDEEALEVRIEFR